MQPFNILAMGAPTYPLSQTPTTFSETGYNTAVTGHIYTSTFAEAIYDTTATSITINSDNDLYTDYPAFTELGLYVNGVYQKVSPGGLGAKANTITLSAGSKRLRIVNGLQSLASGSVKGTYLVSVSANAGLAPVSKSAANRLLFYGDSIAVGGNATSPTGEAYVMLTRNASPSSVALEGWGSRRLYDDASDSIARAALVAKIVAYAPTILWIEVGHNDWFLASGFAASPSNFQTAYAALLDDLHTALPSLQIYAQGMLFRADFTSAAGHTLAEFRAAVAAAATGRAWVTYTDWNVETLDAFTLQDGLHPTTDGHYGLGQLLNWRFGFAAIPTSSAIVTNSGAAIAVASRTDTGMKRITKASGVSAFDAGAVGSTGYTGDFYAKFIRRQSGQDVIVGMNDDPLTDNSYTGINYGFYFKAGGNEIWENGSVAVAGLNGFQDTPVWIVRQGTTLTYRQGFNPATATVLRTVTSVSATLYFDSTLFQVGSYVDAAIYSSFV